MRSPRLACVAILLLSFAAALLLRSAFNYDRVFRPDGVHFQDADAWFHMRTVENLMHHFPRRSGFDPYSGFPTGQPVTTGPFYDLAIGTVAWVAGFGAPSPWLIDAVGAWFPAVLGALLTIPVFFLGRALFHPVAGLAAAVTVAILPGKLMEVSRLGDPDHHVAEALLSTLVLLFLVLAVRHHRPFRFGLPAGVCLGCFLATRPAGGFLVVLIGAWALVECAVSQWRRQSPAGIWLLTAPMLFLAWLLFLPARGLIFSNFAELEIWTAIAAISAAAGLAALLERFGAPRWIWFAAVAGALAAGTAGLTLLRPREVHDLLHAVAHFARGAEASTVVEMRPLMTMDGPFSWRPLFAMFGTAWMVALAALILLLRRPFSSPGVTLFLAWTLLMFLGTLMMTRMAWYAAVNVAVLAGYAAWRLMDQGSLKRRAAWAAAFLFVVAPPCLAFVPDAVDRPDPQSPEWASALAWLREHTPEPLGTAAAFDRYYPALAPGQTFHYPPGAYGILNWWDYGHWITAEAHRIPVSNGMQTHADLAARFYLATGETAAAQLLHDISARYVLEDGGLLTFSAQVEGMFPVMPVWIGKSFADYLGLYALPGPDGSLKPVLVFYPDYYRTMAVRLFLTNGEAVEPHQATRVIFYRQENGWRRITAIRTFETWEEAGQFARAHAGEQFVLGGTDPLKSCVPLPKMTRFRLAYHSSPESSDPLFAIGNVKIFEFLDDRLAGAPLTGTIDASPPPQPGRAETWRP